MNKVNILSMGWRSHWLARRLSSIGIKVSLYEVTDQAGWSHPEDIDGPFPFSITLHSPEDFVNPAQEDDAVEQLKAGFCLSTLEGNLAWDALNREQVLSGFKERFEIDSAEGEGFWFHDFLKSFSKTVFKKSSSWSESDDESEFNLKSDLYIRRSDRMTYQTSLDLLRERGVEVQSVSSQDLHRILLEVKEFSKNWIMGLTIAELKLLTATEAEVLKTYASSFLGWHRKRFFYESKNLSSLPTWSVWVNSPFAPWKEENLVILIKGKQGNYLDVWTLEEIYKTETKEDSILRAHDFLNDKFRHVEFAPQKSENLEGALKTLFPVTRGKEVLNDTSYIWNSPMEWKGYGMDLVYDYQYNLAQTIYDKGEERI